MQFEFILLIQTESFEPSDSILSILEQITGASLGIPSHGFHFSFTKNFVGSKYHFLKILLNKFVICVKIHGFHYNRTKKSTGSAEPVEPVLKRPLNINLHNYFNLYLSFRRASRHVTSILPCTTLSSAVSPEGLDSARAGGTF